MTKSPGGFNNLADKIYVFKDLKDSLENFVNSEKNLFNKKLLNLFSASYGEQIRRKGRNKKRTKTSVRATSLISKYAYFLTGYKFPIYDSLVPKGYNLIKGRIKNFKGPNISTYKDEESIKGYFNSIRILQKHVKVSYDDLDQFLWLWGQVRNGKKSAQWLELNRNNKKIEEFRQHLLKYKLPVKNSKRRNNRKKS
jgi:hypothetical protein